MQTLTVQIKDSQALKVLKDLERLHSIEIVDGMTYDAPSFKGKKLTLAAFRAGIQEAEQAPTFSLDEVKKEMGQTKKPAAQILQIRLSANALRDINEITGFIAFIERQPLSAIKVGEAIFHTIDRIALHPIAFKECHEIPT